jgi:hypothetical protein
VRWPPPVPKKLSRQPFGDSCRALETSLALKERYFGFICLKMINKSEAYSIAGGGGFGCGIFLIRSRLVFVSIFECIGVAEIISFIDSACECGII